MKDDTFTLKQIKEAYFAEFHEAGELYFDYLGTPEENLKSTEADWNDFVYALEKAKSNSAI